MLLALLVRRGMPNSPACVRRSPSHWKAELSFLLGLGESIVVPHLARQPETCSGRTNVPGTSRFPSSLSRGLAAFRGPRYLTVGGKPIFIVYSALDLPDTKEFTDPWNELALKAGLPGVYFLGMSNKHGDEILRPFDMLTEFGPVSLLGRLLRSRAVRLWRRRDFSSIAK